MIWIITLIPQIWSFPQAGAPMPSLPHRWQQQAQTRWTQRWWLTAASTCSSPPSEVPSGTSESPPAGSEPRLTAGVWRLRRLDRDGHCARGWSDGCKIRRHLEPPRQVSTGARTASTFPLTCHLSHLSSSLLQLWFIFLGVVQPHLKVCMQETLMPLKDTAVGSGEWAFDQPFELCLQRLHLQVCSFCHLLGGHGSFMSWHASCCW